MKTTLGGDRLGSGQKQEISMKNYSRSTHDLGYIWRSSMSAGTLVPFMSEVALPGDSFDINLNCDVKTLPTVGPLFGRYKVQLDVFECPIRLYNGKLHMNMLGVGLDMKEIKLPQYKLHAKYDETNLTDNAQINSSSIYSYLNVRGLGRAENDGDVISREFNAVPLLSYWDIYKNYYSNKNQTDTDGDGIGVLVHGGDFGRAFTMEGVQVGVNRGGTLNTFQVQNNNVDINLEPVSGFNPSNPFVEMKILLNAYKSERHGTPLYDEGVEYLWNGTNYTLSEMFADITIQYEEGANGQLYILARGWRLSFEDSDMEVIPGVDDAGQYTEMPNEQTAVYGTPELHEFKLKNIDDMRMELLENVRNVGAIVIDGTSPAPYGSGLGNAGTWDKAFCLGSQEGLGIKTYQSDLNNNWISTEWLDGDNGVNDVSAVLISQNSEGSDVVTMDALNLSQKVYNMLNRIAVSGGTYDDWLDAVYTHERAKSVESPIYHGSLIKELGFEEVVSLSDTDVQGTQQPMGTLAGRGRLTGKNKGGKMNIKVSEPSYIIGIVSLTPLIDYSQGNKYDTNLKTLDNLHKPALDGIGFEDKITDTLAWFDTEIEQDGTVNFQTNGKQPAWINYMSNVNQCRGNFAEQEQEMFMTLNRRYEHTDSGISDLTTYVDPSKYNYIFAQESLSSQNFWVQISNQITARRKMSAKIIPNL